MYEVHLFQYKSQFNTVFDINPGNQYSQITFIFLYFSYDARRLYSEEW
jgi:hypothetical protein